MPPKIREPRAEEASALAEIHVATWRETYSHLLPEDYFSQEYVARRRQLWGHLLAHSRLDTVVRVADVHGEIVGFAWVGPSEEPDSAGGPCDRTLHALYVYEAHHGSGIGQALLDETLGSGPASLWVAKGNARAVGFYRRNGFRFDGAEQIDPRTPLITAARMVR